MATLNEHTQQRIHTYWATFLGCTPEHFNTSQTLVVGHTGLGDYHGVWYFTRKRSLLISIPPSLEPRRKALQHLTIEALDDLNTIIALLGSEAIERVVGPAVIRYADQYTFHPRGNVARLLVPDDDRAIEHLRAACAELDWEHGGGNADDVRAGVFLDGQLVSLASYSVWGGALAHIAIITHPQYRGHNFGTAAVSALAVVALERGLVLQYRTLQSNTASQAIGRALGFLPWATTLALRLHPMTEKQERYT